MRTQEKAGGALAPPAHTAWFCVLSGLDFDAPRLRRRALRDGELQHPVEVRRLDGFGIDALGQREAPQERAGGALDALVAVLGRLLLRAALALDRQNALVGRDFDVLALNARQIRRDDEAVGFLVNVDLRDPADGRAVGDLAQSTIELPLQAAHESPGLVTNDGHAKKLLLNKVRTETKNWLRSAWSRSARMRTDVWCGLRSFKSMDVNAAL